MLTRTSKAYSQIVKCSYPLQEGVILSIDPSIGSTSSQPGWAVYTAGKLQCSGTLEINPEGTQWQRLQRLRTHMYGLMQFYTPDVLVYEDIPAQRHGGGNAEAHASLLKAVGVILSISGPDHYVGLLPVSWKKMVRESYFKGDEQDAIEIGWIAIQEAKRISEEEEAREGKKRNRRKGKDKKRTNET